MHVNVRVFLNHNYGCEVLKLRMNSKNKSTKVFSKGNATATKQKTTTNKTMLEHCHYYLEVEKHIDHISIWRVCVCAFFAGLLLCHIIHMAWILLTPFAAFQRSFFAVAFPLIFWFMCLRCSGPAHNMDDFHLFQPPPHSLTSIQYARHAIHISHIV